MAVHVIQMNTNVTAQADNMPWSHEQIDMLVRLVLERLEQQDRTERAMREETRLRPYVQPGKPDA